MKIVSFGLLAALLLWSTSCTLLGTQELLIAVKRESVPYLISSSTLDPTHTGLSSLDVLNERWGVTEMTAVYPNLSADDETAAEYGLAGVYKLVVPQGTNLEEMIAEYEADPNVDYAEANAPVEIE